MADLVGIQNRFHGEWLGPAQVPGRGLLRWTGGEANCSAAPVLTVRDKGKLQPRQAVNWVIPGDAIHLVASVATDHSDFSGEIVEARHLGELTLATVRLDAVPNANLSLTLPGTQRQALARGTRVGVRLDPDRIHVMPVRSRPVVAREAWADA